MCTPVYSRPLPVWFAKEKLQLVQPFCSHEPWLPVFRWVAKHLRECLKRVTPHCFVRAMNDTRTVCLCVQTIYDVCILISRDLCLSTCSWLSLFSLHFPSSLCAVILSFHLHVHGKVLETAARIRREAVSLSNRRVLGGKLRQQD